MTVPVRLMGVSWKFGNVFFKILRRRLILLFLFPRLPFYDIPL